MNQTPPSAFNLLMNGLFIILIIVVLSSCAGLVWNQTAVILAGG